MQTQQNTVKVEKTHEPSIWVACLSAYNSGYLHGAWIVPKKTVEELQEQINEVLKTSPVGDPEEWAIFDYDIFPNLGENPSLESIVKVQEAIEEHGQDIVLGFLENWSLEDLDHIEDAYYGRYSDWSEFAQEQAECCIGEKLNDGSIISNYFDWSKWESDLQYDYHECDTDGGIIVFNKNWQEVA